MPHQLLLGKEKFDYEFINNIYIKLKEKNKVQSDTSEHVKK